MDSSVVSFSANQGDQIVYGDWVVISDRLNSASRLWF